MTLEEFSRRNDACQYYLAYPTEQGWAELRAKVSPWIPVSEQLPEPSGSADYLPYDRSATVLVTDGKGQWTGYLMRDADDTNRAPWWIMAGPDMYNIDGVTHWQPLSELPK